MPIWDQLTINKVIPDLKKDRDEEARKAAEAIAEEERKKAEAERQRKIEEAKKKEEEARKKLEEE